MAAMKPWSPPALRWAGSKRQLLPALIDLLPPGARYIEPFAGSACLFFAVRPSGAVLGDSNRELISFYETLRRHPRLIARRAHGWSTDPESYYRVRALDGGELGDVERAARFLYLNRLCFNGVYRTNRLGRFNVPRGRHTGAIPSEAALVRCAHALHRCELRHGDFERTVADAREGDVVYLDPPYTQNPEHAYGVYGYGSFDASQLGRMLACLAQLDRAGARFLFSYADDPEFRAVLPSDWIVRELSTRGRVAAQVSSRALRREILVTNTGNTE